MRTLVCVPCRTQVDTDFMTSILRIERVKDTHFSFLQGALVYDSRNAFAANAITQEYDRLMFIDSDMVFQPDVLKRLSADMDTGIDYVSALCFSRKPPIKPMIYTRCDIRTMEDGTPCQDTEHYYDYPQDSLFRIQGSGTGCVMISVPVLKAVWDQFGPPFMPTQVMGEDLAFCYRLNQLHIPMYCDSAVKLGHIGQAIFDENVYLNQRQAEHIAHNLHWPCPGETEKAEGEWHE